MSVDTTVDTKTGARLPAELVASSLFLLFCYALSAAASLRVRTARTAFLFTGGVVAALVTLPDLLSGALRPLAGSRPTAWTALWDWIEALDPAIVLSRTSARPWGPGYQADGGTQALFRFMLLYLPVTLLLPVEMVVRFRKIALRA